MSTPSPHAHGGGDEASGLLDRLCETTDALLRVLDEETALVRAGRLRAAAKLAPEKADLARAYAADAGCVAASAASLTRYERPRVARLRERHAQLRARLQMNLTVLATAHAVSEGLVRGVAGEVARKSAPQTYGASGRANPYGRAVQPIAVSRVL